MTVKSLSVGYMDVNCYLCWDDPSRALVIDPGEEPGRILDAIKRYGLTVQAVVLTHGHFDHMMAAGAVCDAVGAPLWIGAGDEVCLNDPERSLTALFCPQEAVCLRADRLLHEGDMLSVGAESFTVMETPGHSPGSICLRGDGMLIAGDTLFAGSIGRTDFPGSDVSAMRASLRRLFTLPPEIAVYPGHGSATSIGLEKATNPYREF